MRVKLLVAFATIYTVWGSTYLAIAYAIESIPPLLMMGVRSLLAGVLLYGWARASGEGAPARAAWKPAWIAGAMMFLGSHGLLAWAEQHVASGTAALIAATGTFWMMGVEWARPGGRRPTGLSVFGAVLGLAGVAVLMGGAQAVDPIAAGALLLGALLWSIGSIYTRSDALPRTPRLATSLPLLTGGVLLIVVSTLAGELNGFAVRDVDARALLSLLYLIVFGSIIGFTAYVWLLRQTSAVSVSTHNYVNPAVAVLLGWLFADELLTPRMAIAAVIIIASIVLIQWNRARATRTDVRATSPRKTRVERQSIQSPRTAVS